MWGWTVGVGGRGVWLNRKEQYLDARGDVKGRGFRDILARFFSPHTVYLILF